MKDVNFERFCGAVELMREAQKNYFKFRSDFYLQLAKKREKQVDAMLAEFKENQLFLLF